MVFASNDPPVNNRSYTNAGTHRDIQTMPQTAGRAPAPLTHCGRIDVGLYCYRDAQSARDLPTNIKILPPRFGGRQNTTVFRRVEVKLQRTKRAYPQTDKAPIGPRLRTKELDNLTNRLLGLPGRDFGRSTQLIRAVAGPADELGTARLNTPENRNL